MGYDDVMGNTEIEVSTATAVETTRVEDDAYVKFATRVVRSLAKRAGSNIATLAALVELNRFTDQLVVEAVQELRAGPVMASWAEIGAVLGVTRQAAQARFGGIGARQPGGQRGDLR